MKLNVLVLLFLVIVLAACGPTDSPETPIENARPSNDGGAYPVSVNSSDNNPGYPDNVMTNPLPTNLPLVPFSAPVLPNPISGKGSVVGRLVDSITNSPAVSMTVYIGLREPLDQSSAHVVTIQENSSPKAVSDENGYFIITDLDPNIYSLVLWSPLGSKVVADLSSNMELSIEVVADNVTVIGDVPFVFP